MSLAITIDKALAREAKKSTNDESYLIMVMGDGRIAEILEGESFDSNYLMFVQYQNGTVIVTFNSEWPVKEEERVIQGLSEPRFNRIFRIVHQDSFDDIRGYVANEGYCAIDEYTDAFLPYELDECLEYHENPDKLRALMVSATQDYFRMMHFLSKNNKIDVNWFELVVGSGILYSAIEKPDEDDVEEPVEKHIIRSVNLSKRYIRYSNGGLDGKKVVRFLSRIDDITNEPLFVNCLAIEGAYHMNCYKDGVYHAALESMFRFPSELVTANSMTIGGVYKDGQGKGIGFIFEKCLIAEETMCQLELPSSELGSGKLAKILEKVLK